ncbi:MAG: LacI family transcriptional regulator [Tannerellaceae bacterium]|nr:LacI family transcriptional regulator [Tannerellaceae bacterium]
MPYTTIKDIANELHISPSTVSRALRGEYNVKKETRDSVVAVAGRLGYTPDQSAVGLRRKRTYTIGVIVPEMVTSFFITIINIIQNEIKKRGYKLIIAQSQEDPEIEYSNLLLMEEYRVEGIILSVCHLSKNNEAYLRLQQKGIQLVFFDRVPSIDGTKVIIDDYKKAFFMVEYLIRSGKKRILHLAGPTHIQNAIDRKRAYQDAHKKFGIEYDPQLLVDAGVSIEDGEKAVRKIKEEKNTPFDAIFSFTDTLAIGAKNYLQTHGYKIPEDVALAGFSGSLLSTIIQPQLTTVEQPLEDMGKTAANLLLNKIEKPTQKDNTIILEAEIKYRGSTERS